MSSATQPFVLRWGVVASGWISSVFVTDILLDPQTRGVADVVHTLVAVGSRDEKKAREFIDMHAPGSGAKAYGSYDGVYADASVDVVYIGSPHTHHYENARDALLAGKHVLVEKPVTVNAAELRALLDVARDRQLFFMEAMWTRFLPIADAVKRAAEDPKLGDVRVLQADLSGDMNIHNIPLTHRVLDPQLGGGVLLDGGPYPLVWAIIALYERPQNKGAKPSKVTGAMVKTELTGVDSNTTCVLNFQSLGAQAILSNSFNAHAVDPPLTIRFAKGQITVKHPIYKPPSFAVRYYNDGGEDEVVEHAAELFNFEGGGWHFQADEVARCVRDGKTQSRLWGWDKSLLEMEILDEVRRQGGYALPPGVEKVVAN